MGSSLGLGFPLIGSKLIRVFFPYWSLYVDGGRDSRFWERRRFPSSSWMTSTKCLLCARFSSLRSWRSAPKTASVPSICVNGILMLSALTCANLICGKIWSMDIGRGVLSSPTFGCSLDPRPQRGFSYHKYFKSVDYKCEITNDADVFKTAGYFDPWGTPCRIITESNDNAKDINHRIRRDVLH